MDKQDKELLLKDLCARLPYGVKIKFNDGTDDVYNLDGNIHGRFTENVIQAIDDLELKPYLRPMLSMTEEERRDWSGKVLLSKAVFSDKMDVLYDFCNAHHLDYRGLIEKGLALEAPDSMYDFK